MMKLKMTRALRVRKGKVAEVTQAEVIAAAYDALVEKAVLLLAGAPFWKFIGEPTFARLSIDGDTATLMWPEADSYYDSITIETNTTEFPAALLLMPDDEIPEWKKEQRRIYDEQVANERRIRAEQAKVQKEANDRAAYERLKQKFG